MGDSAAHWQIRSRPATRWGGPRTPGRRDLILLAAAVACGGLPHAMAGERYEGVALLRGTERVAYRETDWLTPGQGVAQRLVLYRCAQGAPFARKLVLDAPSALAPDFDFFDARDGHREGVRTTGGVRQIYVQENAHQPLQVHLLPHNPQGVLDAGFDAFVRLHWRELMAGSAQRVPFLIPSRFRYLDFTLAWVRDADADGQAVRGLKMRLTGWYGFALPTLALTYDRQGTTLLQFEGIGTIRDDAGHNQDVRIVFPPAEHHRDIAPGELERARTEPLVAHCPQANPG